MNPYMGIDLDDLRSISATGHTTYTDLPEALTVELAEAMWSRLLLTALIDGDDTLRHRFVGWYAWPPQEEEIQDDDDEWPRINGGVAPVSVWRIISDPEEE